MAIGLDERRYGRVSVGMLLGAGLVGCAPRPLVVPFAPPRDPITSLDVVEDGHTEVAVNVAHTAMLVGLFRPPFDLFMLAPGVSASATHGVGRFELRARSGMQMLSWQHSLGLGYQLPSAGRWDFVASADLATWSHQGTFKVPEESEWDQEEDLRSYEARGPGAHPYSYRMFTPTFRARAIWAPKPQLRVPIALRYAHTGPWVSEGLYPFEETTQDYISLTLGAIWKPERSCISAGLGVTLESLVLPTVQGSLSCEYNWKKIRENAG